MDSDKTVTATFVIMGDVDNSGAVDLSDAVLSLKVCTDSALLGTLITASVNNDNCLGLEEIVYILQKIAALR